MVPTQMYNDMWKVVSNEFSEEDAKCYVRMNWKDMTPYSVAKTLREHKYKGMSDKEFDALWYRCTLKEYWAQKDEFLAKEKAAEDAEKAKEEAKKAADKAAEEAKAAAPVDVVEATGI